MSFVNPEERLASLWVKRLGLVHPIDVTKIVSDFADIQFETFPFDADAVLISRGDGSGKARIYLSSKLSETRMTFTLAHELAHILIPWHTGNFVCNPVDSLVDKLFLKVIHQELEREANRFAAEFLMPEVFMRKLFQESSGVGEVIEKLSGSCISKIAISFKLLKVLPPGFLMVAVDGNMVIVNSGRSDQTYCSPPSRGNFFVRDRFDSIGARVEVIVANSQQSIYWIDLRGAVSIRPSTEGLKDSRSILLKILQDTGSGVSVQSINGIIGAANSIRKHSPGSDLFTVLSERFRQREGFESVIAHPEFSRFLAKKAEEIESKP